MTRPTLFSAAKEAAALLPRLAKEIPPASMLTWEASVLLAGLERALKDTEPGPCSLPGCGHYRGLEQALGPCDERTLAAREDLCDACLVEVSGLAPNVLSAEWMDRELEAIRRKVDRIQGILRAERRGA